MALENASKTVQQVCQWLAKNGDRITQIFLFNDEMPLQKFSFDKAWENHQVIEQEPSSWTLINSKNVEDGTNKPVYSDAGQQLYVRKLEQMGFPGLQLFPTYCIAGTEAAALQRNIAALCFWQAALREARHSPAIIKKNIMEEVDQWGPFVDLLGQELNLTILKKKMSEEAEAVYVVGPRFIVAETVQQLCDVVEPRKIRVLDDCCPHLKVPWLVKKANKLLKNTEKKGVHFISHNEFISTAPA